MTNQDKPSVEGLMGLVRAYGAHRIDNDRSRTAASDMASTRAYQAIRNAVERLASEAAPAAQPATPLREVLSDGDRKLMEQALAALTKLVARIEANGGIGDYTKGPAFVMQGAYDAIAAIRSRLDGEKT